MSLKVLLRCSDEEFEKLISLMDLESVLDIITELQTAMDQEQQKFDELSLKLSHIKNQASAEFKRHSEDLVKSQNMIALLISRNMHCFHVSNEPEEDVDTNTESPFITFKTESPVIQRECTDSYQNSAAYTSDKNILTSCANKAATEVTNGNELTPSHSSYSSQTSIVPKTNLKRTSSGVSSHSASEQPNGRSPPQLKLESTAMLTVISPRQPIQDIKPKRILKVRTTSLPNSDSTPASTPRSPSNSSIQSPTSASTANVKTVLKSKINLPISTRNHNFTSSPAVKKHTNSEHNDETVTSTTARSPVSPSSVISALRLTPTTNSSTRPFTDDKPSPTSSSYINLSPRSDISNLATPRSLSTTPRLPVSSILELDIPETSIDGGNRWGEPICTAGGGETVSDKVSCTTDESGFTSASSDSDITLTAPDIVYDYHSEDDEKVEERVFMKSWNPSKLLAELYTIKLAKESSVNDNDIINMEGYLERLPVGKNKNTLLKTWKRTYCKAIDGVMYFYDRKSLPEAQSYMSLMGGVLEELSNKMIGIDDMRGHYLMVRCPSDVDHLNWKRSFYTQVKCSPATSYIRPCLLSKPTSQTPKVIIVDLGSTSIRAGLLGSTASYPQLFFPSVSAINAKGQTVFGEEVYLPENRANGLHRPIAACKEIDTYRINVQVLPELFGKIFLELNIDAQHYTVLLSTPHNFSLRLKEEVINVLIQQHQVAAVNMVNQSLLIPYIYNATSGIVVDIGERIEIVAITDGYLVEGGLNRQSFGGAQITDTLNSYLVEHRLFSPAEQLIARLIKERTCFVSQDYGDDLLKYMCNDGECEANIDLSRFDLPSGSHLRNISIDTARFKAPEGLIKTELLGVDSPTLPKLIDQAVQKCPMDVRREMWQSIYLSGGTTLTQGFAERLQKELGKIAPSSITIQVHSSPHRYHAAYIGACMLARLPTFLDSCITKNEWLANGPSSLNKWKGYFQG